MKGKAASSHVNQLAATQEVVHRRSRPLSTTFGLH